MKKLYIVLSFFFSLNLLAQAPTGSNNAYIPGDLIVELSESANIRALLGRAPENSGLAISKELSPSAHIWLLKFDASTVSQEIMLDWLSKQWEVELAQNNYYLNLRSTIPNDVSFNSQWHHVNTGQTGGTADADIDSDLAWDITTGGTTASGHDIVIALIESGNLDHQDLTGNRWFNVNEIPNNGIDDDGNGYVDDYDGWNPVQNNDNYGTGAHGTNCLGMMGAKGNNGLNVVGANWDVKLMVIGDYNINTDANAIAAYQYALDMRTLWNNTGGAQGAFVVATSSSWGIDGEDPNNHPVWCSFYTTMGQAGILNVGATTNQNLNVDTAGDMPTACDTPYMIGVGRTDHNDNTAGGYGVSTIEFGAPGINVVTTAGTNTITTTTGTSFSCPLTAGVIGLAYSIPCSDFMNIVLSNPQAGADLVLQALLNGTDAKTQLANKFVTGGRLNARNTLDELMASSCNGSVCFGPNGIALSSVGEDNATLLFNAQAEANATNLYWRPVGDTVWVLESNISSPFNFSSLNACSSYEFYLESVCGGDTTSNPSPTQTFNTLGCGACIDNQYCSNSASDGADEWIESFTVGTFTNASGNDGGFGDFTGNPIQLAVNNTYDIDIEVAWGGALYNEHSRIWIDLDQNGVFEASELVFDQGTADQTVNVTGQINIPALTPLGITRMRVQMAYVGGNTTLPEVCASYTWGEVEDYCIEFIPGSVCGLNVNSTVTDPLCEGNENGSIDVSASAGSGNYAYQWTENLGSNNALSNLNEGTYTLVITDLQNNCDTTIQYILSYQNQLELTFEIIDASCAESQDGSLTATATGGNNYIYQWAQGPNSNTWSNIGSGFYTLQVSDANGCVAVDSAQVLAPSQEFASFSWSTNNLSVQLNNTSSPGSYLWDFGDGTTSTETSPSHTFAQSGVYQVCLTVTTDCGSYTKCNSININNAAVNENFVQYVSVFPNPFNDFVEFRLEHPLFHEITLYDLVGKVVVKSTIENNAVVLNLSSLNNGNYFYSISTAEGKRLVFDKLVKIK